MALLHLFAMLLVPIGVGALVVVVLRRFAAAAAARLSKDELARTPTLRGCVVAASVTTTWRSRAARRMVDGVVIETQAGPGLVLATADGEVEIAGRVEAAAGSRVVWRGKQSFAGGHVVDLSVAPGDEVAAYGRVVETAGGEADYRGTSKRKRLEPETEGGAVRLVAVSPARVRIERPWRQPLVLLVMLPFLWFPVGAAASWSDVDNSTCADTGACGAVPKWRSKHARVASVLKDWLRGHHYVSGARNDADCSASAACLRFGSCHVVGDTCEATKDDDCRASFVCAEYGACSRLVRGGFAQCAPREPGDCALTDVCLRYGWCTAEDGTVARAPPTARRPTTARAAAAAPPRKARASRRAPTARRATIAATRVAAPPKRAPAW